MAGFLEFFSSQEFADILDSYNEFVQEKARPFTLDFSAVDGPLQEYATLANLHLSYFKMILVFLLSYPLGLVMSKLPNPLSKHLFSLAVGIFLAQFCISTAWIHSFITITLAYLLILILPPKYSSTLVFFVTLIYLIYAHIRRMVNLDLNVDFSGPQMVITIKLSSLAFALLDGYNYKKRMAKPDPSKVAEHHEKGLQKIPTILEFYAFFYYFGSFFVGPAFVYEEYISSIDGSKYKIISEKDHKTVHQPKGRTVAWIKLFLTSFSYMLYYVLLVPTYNIPGLVKPEILAQPIYMRFIYFWITMSVERTKYYFAWTIAEGGCVASGFGWNYKNKDFHLADEKHLEGQWDAVNNVDVWAFETAQSVRDASKGWNRLTSAWLRYCVFIRVPKSIRTYATYLVSAFWHGFYPGYYFFFVSAAIAQTVGEEIRSHIRPYFIEGPLKNYKKIYDLIGVLVVPVYVNYLSSSFLLLYTNDIITFWSSIYYVGHWILIPIYIITKMVPKIQTHHVKPKHHNEKHPHHPVEEKTQKQH